MRTITVYHMLGQIAIALHIEEWALNKLRQSFLDIICELILRYIDCFRFQYSCLNVTLEPEPRLYEHVPMQNIKLVQLREILYR